MSWDLVLEVSAPTLEEASEMLADATYWVGRGFYSGSLISDDTRIDWGTEVD